MIVVLRFSRSTMTSSDPNTVRPSRDGVVPRASYILAPLSRNDPTNYCGLQGEFRRWCYTLDQADIFLSILLGDDQTPDGSVTGNKRVKREGVSSGTDHDTLQPRSRELDSPTTTLWLPEYLKKRAATPDYNCDDFIKPMRMVLHEVMKFGARATDVAKVFARQDIDLVEHLLLHLEDLRSTLQRIVKVMEIKLPLKALEPDIEPSAGVVPGAPYILELQPPRVGSNDLSSILRYMHNAPKQFSIFLSILLGEDQPHGEGATSHDRGGAFSGTVHDSLQPHGGEPVTPTTTVWLPEFFKKRDAIPGYKGEHCLKLLIGLFREVLEFGARATDVAKAFARMEINHVEYLLVRPEDLRSTLQRLNTIAEDKDTRELIKMFMPDLETGPKTGKPLDALPDKLLPDIEPIDDDYIKLSIFHHFGISEDEWPEM